MYTTAKAAAILVISVEALRRRITRYNIKPTTIGLDGKRLYLTFDDLTLLMEKPDPLKDIKQELHLYTLDEAATTLEVSRSTIKNWISQDNIEKKKIDPDSKFVFLSRKDLIYLAHKHHRPLAAQTNRAKTTNQHENPHHPQRLYTTEEATKALKVSNRTIRRWIIKYNIEKSIIITDRKRIYISHESIALLAQKQHHKVTKNNHQLRTINPENHSPEDPQLYTIAEIASYLHISERTIRIWIERYNINKTVIATDKKRIYIPYHEIITIVKKYYRKIPKNIGSTTVKNQEGHPQEEPELYTIAEAALFIGIAPRTLMHWLEYDNIYKNIITTDKRRIYISYEDIVTLANMHRYELPDNTDPRSFFAKMQKKVDELAKRAAEIVKLKDTPTS